MHHERTSSAEPDELVDVLDERHLRTDTVDAWVARLNRIGIPAGRIGSIADAIDLAERLGLEPTAEVGEAPKQVRNPITFSRTPITTYGAPPALGEHNDAVRRWLEEEGAR
ncbi:CoA transferase [Streptomyces samsunensis]|uniref:CoA transferase n=1 Tax=Streptomyces malaysiensis subsp. samsunensis TaxID=459658 RepID=A0A9X2LVG8_STRMQ|nr:CoA transferase [Streptomyces samsunensis]MCQ8831290.1 CoA transferase [Streptomyces samsunensis]